MIYLTIRNKNFFRLGRYFVTAGNRSNLKGPHSRERECVSVYERERERERESVSVCACMRERERENEYSAMKTDLSDRTSHCKKILLRE